MKSKEKLRLFGDIFRTLAWALGVLKKYRYRLYFYIALLILQSIYQVYMTSKVGSIVDLALEDDMNKLVMSGAFFALLYAVNVVITIASTRYASRNYNGMYNDLELMAYRKLMDASWEGLFEYHSGDIITRLSSDVKTVAGNTSGLVPTMISKLSLILGAGILIVYLDPSMIFLAIVIAPIVIVASRIFMGKIYDCETQIREIESLINSYNVETFSNIHAVKAFGLGDYFYNKMKNIEVRRKKVDLRTNKYIMSSYATSYLAGIIGASIMIGWMFYRVHTGNISFGSLSVITFLAFQISFATEALLDLVPTIMAYMASADRVKKLLSIPDEKSESCNEEMKKLIASRKDGKGIGVQGHNLFFKYNNGTSVFEDVSFEANPGDMIAFIGSSGEGKTTMLRILLGIVTADKGRAYASNGSMEVELGSNTRCAISFVPQGNTMMAGTILENLKMVNRDSTKAQIKDVLETACIYDFVMKLPGGLMFELGQGGQGVSEGQCQRLAIARALLKDTPILLMDEATSSLDVATERRVLDNIKKRYPDKTIILTSHRPTVLTMCDRVYRIADKKMDVVGQEDIQKLVDEF
ncbi:ABC transporter ATP-binding protein [Butyrivibrio sp. AE2032]|uniref:ABC transporter ATP-binding protein n=1 Tax=Butyrivibrio sp. AE2032 TaxID=1458463 RepID=UPI00054DE79E|nr:ABC transporter ATP-binding protein [Butyrivibrio sp. AE2032]